MAPARKDGEKDDEPNWELVLYRLQQIEQNQKAQSDILLNLRLRSAAWGFLAGSIPTIIGLLTLWQSMKSTTGK